MRHEPSAIGPFGQRCQGPQHRPFHDRHGAATCHSRLGGQQLGFHAALGKPRNRIARHGLDLWRDCLDQIKALRCRILFRIGRIEPIDIGQQYQLIRPHRHRNLRGQAVVVTKPDFIRRHRIVFIDDRHHAQTQQRRHRGAAVQIAATILGILQCDQNLARGNAMRRQNLLIGARQPNLPDGSGGLRLLQRQRPIGQTQHLAPQGD